MDIESITFKKFDPQNSGHLSFAVIMAHYKDKWIFVRHNERTTLEIPGGRRELGEDILETAKRELFEETGSLKFHLVPLETYTVQFKDSTPSSSGLLCYAEIDELGELPESEIQEISIHEECPRGLTYIKSAPSF